MENDDLREVEEETSSQEETEEEETSSQEETEEEETSSQEETEEEETSSQEEETIESYFNPNYNRDNEHEEEFFTTTEYSIDSYDYSSYFENLQSLGIIITAFILGVGLALAFALGFKRD